MKQCPQCESIYSDDTLLYCLSDGTSLTPVDDGKETITLVRDNRAATDTRVRGTRAGVSPIFKYLTVVLAGLVVLLGIAGFAAWSIWSWGNKNITPASNLGIQTPAVPVRSPDSVQMKNTATEATPPGTRTTEKIRPSTPDPDPVLRDPETTRITFRKGSIREIVRGVILEKRSFVLRTMEGQLLKATVNSPERCVSFEDGSRSIELATPSGDVGITVDNNCGRPSPFTINVTVR